LEDDPSLRYRGTINISRLTEEADEISFDTFGAYISRTRCDADGTLKKSQYLTISKINLKK